LVLVGDPKFTVVPTAGMLAFVFGSPGGETIGQTELQMRST
jgi:hypothetical protein